jgi:hypothetical protein
MRSLNGSLHFEEVDERISSEITEHTLRRAYPDVHRLEAA